MSGKVSGKKLGLLVGGVVGVDEGRCGLLVVVVLVVVLDWAGQVGSGGILASGRDVVTAEDPEAVHSGLRRIALTSSSGLLSSPPFSSI